MLLDFLRPHMNVSDNGAFLVYPGKTNNPGDIIKGRTFRRLNVTRKIIIKDVPDLIKSALNMQTFALGQRCIRQCRGSPMGSPLSPALCLMVVSISEQIWPINFKQILSNHNLFIRHIRYVDNRFIFGDEYLCPFLFHVVDNKGYFQQGATAPFISPWPTKLLMFGEDMQSDQLHVPAFILILLQFQKWDVANPRTTMPFSNILFSFFLVCTVFAI